MLNTNSYSIQLLLFVEFGVWYGVQNTLFEEGIWTDSIRDKDYLKLIPSLKSIFPIPRLDSTRLPNMLEGI